MCFNQTKWKWNKYFTQSILKYTKPQALPLSNRDCILGTNDQRRGGGGVYIKPPEATPPPSVVLIRTH